MSGNPNGGMSDEVRRLALKLNKMADKLGVALFTLSDLKETMDEATKMTADVLKNNDRTIKELQAKLGDAELTVAELEKKTDGKPKARTGD